MATLSQLTATEITALDRMRDYQASIETLRRDAAEVALIRDLTMDTNKRETFNRLHEHLSRLADEVEQAMIRSALTGP